MGKRYHLSILVENQNPNDRTRWMYKVLLFTLINYTAVIVTKAESGLFLRQSNLLEGRKKLGYIMSHSQTRSKHFADRHSLVNGL